MSKGKSQTTKERRPATVADAYAAFIADREAANVTAGTLAYYRGKLLPFIRWCEDNGAPHVTDITSQHPRTFILTLKERNLSAWTQHGVARAIRAFLRFCVLERMIVDAPNVTFPKLPKELLEPLSPSDITRLLDVCANSRDYAAVLFLVDTGVRAAEFVALNGGDIDIASGTVIVQMGKGRKARVVYFGAKTKRALLRHWREAEKPGRLDPIWTSFRNGERLTESGLLQMLLRLGKRAGVDKCNPHTFRRTFAVWSLRSGMDIYSLQRLMGHEDIAVLRRYLKLTDTDARAAHKRHGAVDNNL